MSKYNYKLEWDPHQNTYTTNKQNHDGEATNGEGLMYTANMETHKD
jgi:hypothetical protein